MVLSVMGGIVGGQVAIVPLEIPGAGEGRVSHTSNLTYFNLPRRWFHLDE